MTKTRQMPGKPGAFSAPLQRAYSSAQYPCCAAAAVLMTIGPPPPARQRSLAAVPAACRVLTICPGRRQNCRTRTLGHGGVVTGDGKRIGARNVSLPAPFTLAKVLRHSALPLRAPIRAPI